jgi:hypothetical protein
MPRRRRLLIGSVSHRLSADAGTRHRAAALQFLPVTEYTSQQLTL